MLGLKMLSKNGREESLLREICGEGLSSEVRSSIVCCLIQKGA
jgi:hypothetical protein